MSVGFQVDLCELERRTCFRREDQENAPKIWNGHNITEIVGTFVLHYDEDKVLRDACWQVAERQAKEIRYPFLVHTQSKVEFAEVKAVRAFDQFKQDLLNDIKAKDIAESGSLLVTMRAIQSLSPTWAAISLLASSLFALELGEDYMVRLKALYAPAQKAYAELHSLHIENKQASLNECLKHNYQPNLAFCPDDLQQGPHHSALIDKNNPNPENRIVIWIP